MSRFRLKEMLLGKRFTVNKCVKCDNSQHNAARERAVCFHSRCLHSADKRATWRRAERHALNACLLERVTKKSEESEGTSCEREKCAVRLDFTRLEGVFMLRRDESS